jgi:hypothetical protein
VSQEETRKVANSKFQMLYLFIHGVFLMLKHWFCWKYQYNNYMFNFIDINSFIPVSCCVFLGPSALLCPGPIMLLRRPISAMFRHFSYVQTFQLCSDISAMFRQCGSYFGSFDIAWPSYVFYYKVMWQLTAVENRQYTYIVGK